MSACKQINIGTLFGPGNVCVHRACEYTNLCICIIYKGMCGDVAGDVESNRAQKQQLNNW